jgi:hypothetical protein
VCIVCIEIVIFLFLISGAGNGTEIIVGAKTLIGLEGNTYLMIVTVSDGCTLAQRNINIHVSGGNVSFWTSTAGYAVMAVGSALAIAGLLGTSLLLCKKYCCSRR